MSDNTTEEQTTTPPAEDLVLIKQVQVRDEHGALHTFGPGDDLPDYAREQMTNPALWGPATGTGPGEMPAFRPQLAKHLNSLQNFITRHVEDEHDDARLRALLTARHRLDDLRVAYKLDDTSSG